MTSSRRFPARAGGCWAVGLLSVCGLTPAFAAEPAAAPAAKPATSHAKPAAADSAKPATSPAKPAAAAPAASPGKPAANHPPSCEVELTGQILGTLPPGMTYWVYVAEGDCLAKNAKILGTMRGSDAGSFGIEVFSRWGADLTVCAAVAKTPESPTKQYGKLPRTLHAEATGEVMFEKLQIKLKAGPEHVFPKAVSGS